MSNPNSQWNRLKLTLKARWSEPDHPGTEPRFQVLPFAKDVATYIMLPILAVLMAQSCNGSTQPKSKVSSSGQRPALIEQDGAIRSQIIDFTQSTPKGSSSPMGLAKRAPGTLVKVRLLNQVETYSNAPVHAVIVDNSLGQKLRGATLIGEASPDSTYERITIIFSLVKPPNQPGIALPVTARALSLNGTLGVTAKKKEGYFARAALGSAQSAFSQGRNGGGDTSSLKDALLQALSSGLLQESGSITNVERNRAHVLTLNPSTIFYAELTDYFPEDMH